MNSVDEIVNRLTLGRYEVQELVGELLKAQSIAIGGLEGAAFAISKTETSEVSLLPVAHIRGGTFDDVAKRTAINAFREIASSVVTTEVDRCTFLKSPGSDQYDRTCITTFLRQRAKPRFALCVFAKAANKKEGDRLLAIARLIVSGYFQLHLIRDALEGVERCHWDDSYRQP